MDRPRRDSRRHNGITVGGLSQPTSATKSALSGHCLSVVQVLLLAATRTRAGASRIPFVPSAVPPMWGKAGLSACFSERHKDGRLNIEGHRKSLDRESRINIQQAARFGRRLL